MNKLTVIIESAEGNYSAYIQGIDGIVATGSTMDEVKVNIAEAIDFFKESCLEDGDELPEVLKGYYQLEFKMDMQSFLELYSGIFTKSGLERITGINQKQLWHYAKGKTHPRPAQVLKMETALHRLGSDLLSVRL